MFRDTLATHLGHPHPGITMAQCCRVLAACRTDALTRMRRSKMPYAATAWAMSRIGVALFLLGTAERLGHAGLLSRIMSH